MILSIDPGPEQSAFCLIGSDYRPVQFGKLPNGELLTHLLLSVPPDTIAIEWVGNYGNIAGQTLFETAYWVGRFDQFLIDEHARVTVRVTRHDVKMNLCGTKRSKDRDVVQALIDRFAPLTPNRGKGLKDSPGFFYGFKSDCWQAYAVGVTVLDQMVEEGRAAVLQAHERVGVVENEPPF